MSTVLEGDAEINADIWQTGISDSVGINKAGLAFPLPASTPVNRNFLFVDAIAISKMFCRARSSLYSSLIPEIQSGRDILFCFEFHLI